MKATEVVKTIGDENVYKHSGFRIIPKGKHYNWAINRLMPSTPQQASSLIAHLKRTSTFMHLSNVDCLTLEKFLNDNGQVGDYIVRKSAVGNKKIEITPAGAACFALALRNALSL